MDIVHSNFLSKIDFICESIRTADFIALDTEFSGLSVGFQDQVHAFDQVEDRYQKLRHNCMRMNAFQIGICCFKWDPKRSCYTSRPFNTFVFPHSDILGNKTLQFKASNIRFLIKNHFDFNKLFTEGVNYQRLSESALVSDKTNASNQKENSQNYSQQRSFTRIGTKSNLSLEDYIRKVQNFVLIAKKTDEGLVLEMNIESYALRRKLSQQLQSIYKDKNEIFTQFQRRSPQFIVRKWKEKESYEEVKAKEASGIQKSKEIKITEQQCELSEFDRIIAGERTGVTIYYEDDSCIAIKDTNPVNPAYFLVISKTKSFSDQADAQSESFSMLFVIANKVATELKLQQGYHVVTNQSIKGAHNYVKTNNLFVHVVSENQLKQPLVISQSTQEESKTDLSAKEDSQQLSKEDLYRQEMGFSLVIEEIINAKKPLIGHNCIYDWLYVYNQFVDKLPETYAEFIKSWNKIFPFTFDNKVLAFNSKAFFKTSLGEVYDKCTNDDKFKHNLKFKFDIKNGFSNYEGTAMLSHYHEAAYDAHMTGVAFAHILKLKEIENIKNGGNSETQGNAEKGNHFKGKGAGGQMSQQVKEQLQVIKNKSCDLQTFYPRTYLNQMMLDSFGSGRVYHFEPQAHSNYLTQITERPEFPETVYLVFKQGFITELSAETVSSLFCDFGDFYAYKATEDSCFFEFFYIDATKVPDRKLETFIKVVMEQPELNVVSGCIHQQAPRFVSHDRFDYV